MTVSRGMSPDGAGDAPDAIPTRDYEELMARWTNLHDRIQHGKTLVCSSDVPIVKSRQGVSQFYVMPQFEELSLTQWVVFLRDLSLPGGRHRHQGGIALFILEGDGYTVANDERLDWTRHDVVYLPIVHGGVDHQHFSARRGSETTFMGIIYEPLIEAMGAELSQLEPKESHPPSGSADVSEGEASRQSNRDAGQALTPTLHGLFEAHRQQRESMRIPTLIRSRDLAADDTEFGELRWYSHPALPGFGGTAPILLFTQRLEPGERTRTLVCPGNGFMFVLEGRPTIQIDGEVHGCRDRDLVCLPSRVEGVQVSVRADVAEPSLVLVALANLSGLGGFALGADLGLI
jgi:gentisate 1,2-dioxygenase